MELWFIYALGAAVFATLVTVLGKVGVKDVDSALATAIRTGVVIVFAWGIVFAMGSQGGIGDISPRTWVFLVLSGLATGGTWLCYFHALKLGNVNKVVPIGKSSTILTMLLAFIILREPIGVTMAIGMVLMAFGTWLMLEYKKEDTGAKGRRGWLFFAVLSAVFGSLVSIFGRIGVVDMDPNLWTALRTIVVLPLSWVMVFVNGKQVTMKGISPKSWVFLVLSGLATGGSWLFFYQALKIGNASLVVPIDKLSIVITMGCAYFIFGEKFSKRSVIGLVFLTVGTLLPTVL